MSVENHNCLQLKSDIIIECRGNDAYFKGGINGLCPFGECVAQKVVNDDDLLVRVFGENILKYPIPVKLKLELIFHCVCPGTRNPNANPNIIMKYTKEKPFTRSDQD